VLLDTLYRPFGNAGRRFAEPARKFRGLIDGVHVYARALHPEKIAALALSESVGDIAGKPSGAARRYTEARLTFQ
jgi:hypothetical protein